MKQVTLKKVCGNCAYMESPLLKADYCTVNGENRKPGDDGCNVHYFIDKFIMDFKTREESIKLREKAIKELKEKSSKKTEVS